MINNDDDDILSPQRRMAEAAEEARDEAVLASPHPARSKAAQPFELGGSRLVIGTTASAPCPVDVADRRIMIRASKAAVTRLATSWMITNGSRR